MKILIRIAKWGGVAFAGLLLLTLVMEFVDPEGMKQAREENAKAAAEAKEKRDAAAADKAKEQQGIKPAHMAAGVIALEMKNGGAVRPRGDTLNALARKAANELDIPSERRSQFVSDFEWAFNIAWDKSR